MRRSALPIVTVLSLALLLPQQFATAADTVDQPQSDAVIQQIGPGQYFAETQSFEVAESDTAFGAVGRRHRVVASASGGPARPESAPASRPEMGVFGPGWEAEFLGGTLNRTLQQSDKAVVVTDLDVGESSRFELKSSLSYPSGGGVNTYEDANGSKIIETAKWDDAAGTLTTSISETIGGDLTATEAGADAGAPVTSADLSPTFTWKQPRGLTGSNTWRVTGAGNKAFGMSSVEYDAKGRISAIKEPAAGEAPAESVTIRYADQTSATGAAFGDYAGRAKEITVTTGATAQTVARYAYDSAGRLRTVTNPVEGTGPDAAYSYDAAGRLATSESPRTGEWNLTFAGDTAAPEATATGLERPASESPLQGAAGITDPGAVEPPQSGFTPGEISDPQAYPRYCSTAASWLWYARKGCASWAAHNGWHKPLWRQLPTGYWVVGIVHDHCTKVTSRPLGFNFTSACDMHDYGYGLIGNTYKGYKYYLDRNRKASVDDLFYTTLRYYTCPKYRLKGLCRKIAWSYRQGVRLGSPKSGADATHSTHP